MSSRYKNSDGDWTCSDPNCSNLNFARRTSCNRCGKDKVYVDKKTKKQGVEIGKLAAEKSHGLFSADDWQCSKCGNVNWARRQTCNMCNAPKFGEVEERTGYGGGFNERGGVEYIHRDDSDDEYDEFGRKKKKFRSSNASENPKINYKPVATVNKEKEADSASDEDDDCDLSKYDLWGSDEDTKDMNKNGNVKEKSEEKRRTESPQSYYSTSSQSSKSNYSKSKSRSRSSSSSSSSSSSRNSRSRSRSKDHHIRSRSRDKASKRKYSYSSSSRSCSREKKAR